MNYEQVLADALAMQDRWREQDERWARERAEFDAAMSIAHMVAEQACERHHHALLYLMFNPAPTPEAFAAILGVDPDVTCSTCRGRCPSREACALPEPTPAPRMTLPRMFRPDYTVDGPHRRRRSLSLRRLFAALFRRH